MPLDQEPMSNPFIHDEGIHVINLKTLRIGTAFRSASLSEMDDFEQDMEQPYYASGLGWIMPRP